MDLIVALGASLVLLALALLPAAALASAIAYAVGISFIRAFVMLVVITIILRTGRTLNRR